MLSNLTNFYSRSIGTRPEKRATLFGLVFFVNLVIFGYFGIFRGIVSINEKKDTLAQLDPIISNLESNLITAEELEPYIYGSSGALYLSKAIADTPATHIYLEELVQIAAKYQFALDKFSVQSSFSSNTVALGFTVLGNTYSMPQFISDVQQMGRFTTVESVIVESEKDQVVVRVNIYFTDENK